MLTDQTVVTLITGDLQKITLKLTCLQLTNKEKQQMTISKDNIEQSTRVYKALLEGKARTDEAFNIIKQDAIYYCPAFPTLKTVNEAIENYFELKGSHHPIVQITFASDPIITWNDNYICFVGSVTATHTGRGGPVEPSDPPKVSTDDYCEMFKLDDEGRIVEIRDLWDYYRAFRALGWPLPNPDLLDNSVK